MNSRGVGPETSWPFSQHGSSMSNTNARVTLSPGISPRASSGMLYEAQSTRLAPLLRAHQAAAKMPRGELNMLHRGQAERLFHCLGMKAVKFDGRDR